MKSRYPPLPIEAQQAADRGDIIAAIKITRMQTGLGLKTAKEAVNAYLQGLSGEAMTDETPIPVEAIEALNQGNYINALKHTRAATGLGLKAAKKRVEDYVANHPRIQTQLRTAASPHRSDMGQAFAVTAFILGAGAALLWVMSRR